MAADLGEPPATGLQVQASGDAHLSNFGLYATPERRLVFDLNDFDETLPAPFEWDVKRFAASAAVLALDHGASRKRAAALGRGRDRLLPHARSARFSLMPHLELFYAEIDVEEAEAR